MGIGWVEVVAGVAYAASSIVSALFAVVACHTAKRDVRRVGTAFLTSALAIFLAFKGYALAHAVFSGDIVTAGYWSWFAGRTFEFSWTGILNLLAIIGACLTYAVGYSVFVALTVSNVPTLGHSRAVLRLDATLFVVVLGLDYVWLDKAPGLLF